MPVLREVGGSVVFPLRGVSAVIGRAPDCDIVVTARKVSARHALIVREGANFFVEDLGSSNGTFINGARIAVRTPLRPGDKIDLFGLILQFADDDSTPPSGTPPAFRLVESPSGAGPAAVMSSVEVTGSVHSGVAPQAKLRAVLEFSRHLSRTLDLKEVPPRILESLFAIFPQADRGFVLLRDPGSGKLQPKAVRYRRPTDGEAPAISRTIIDHALKTGQAILSADAGMDSRFDSSMSVRQHKIRSIMCVPMLDDSGERLGVIQLDTQSYKTPFSQDDLDVLAVASLQASRAVELARLHLERRDLESANQIQKSFLPAERPRAEGLRFFDHYAPAQQIGGDYFDYVPLPGNRLAVAVGDVAGKGVAAALLMARLSAEARFSLASESSPSAAVRRLNLALKRVCGEDRFVTLLLAVIDLSSMQMTLVNAGHLPPFLRRASGEVVMPSVGGGGIPLGVMDRPYPEATMPLSPGDVLLLATDGVTEARNPDNDLYGLDRLQAAMAKASADAESVGQMVLDDVRAFSAGRPAGDDLTLVCVSRDAP